MAISRIKIQNFRSLKDVEILPSMFNVFVGQNNHGKTNLFEAIEWFYTGTGNIDEIKHLRASCEVVVEIEFSEIQKGMTEMKNEKNQSSLRKQIGDEIDTLLIRRSSKDPKNRVLVVDGKEEPPSSGFDKALNDLLPKWEYVDTKMQLEHVCKYSKTTPVGQMLSGVLNAILEENPEYKKFQEKFAELFGSEDSDVRIELNKLAGKVEVFLKKQFPDDTKIDFKVESPAFDDLLKNFATDVDDGVRTSAEEKGDGMQRAIMLAIIQAFAEFRKSNEVEKTFVFLIDEAELHLHPTAQRALKLALLDLCSGGDQVLLSTHSSVLMAEDDESQTVFSVEKVKHETQVKPLSPKEKVDVVYELLGGSPSDLLLPRNFLIVEGRTEQKFLSKIIERFYPKDFEGIQIIHAGGDIVQQRKTMYSIHQAFVPVGVSNPVYRGRAILLCDKPVSASQISAMNDFKTCYPHIKEQEQLFTLPYGCLEEYYPGKYAKKCGEVLSKDKVLYAEEVASNISQKELEEEMVVVSSALLALKAKAYI